MGWYTAWLSGALTNKHCNEKSVECWPWSTGSRSPSEHTHRNIRYRQKKGPNKDGTFKDSFNHIPQNKARLQSSAEAWIEECFEKVTIETKLEKKCKILSSQDTSLLSLSMYLHFSLPPPFFFIPFLQQLPVITSNTIVRCRSCRTYINPFVTFLDQRRWKCNLCYRVNDGTSLILSYSGSESNIIDQVSSPDICLIYFIVLCSNRLFYFLSCSVPDEFMYNPVTRSYGEPHKRPEVQNATVEFIASSDYMVSFLCLSTRGQSGHWCYNICRQL